MSVLPETPIEAAGGPGDIVVVRVNIPLLIKNALPNLDLTSAATRGPEEFEVSDFCSNILTPEEIVSLNNFKTLKKQIEWISGRAAAKAALAAFNGAAGSGAAVAYREGGAPFFPGYSNLSLSITHSGELAAAAVSSDYMLGIDAERIEPRDIGAVMRVAFSAEERKIHRDSGLEEVLTSFCIKEAWLKYLGRGFAESPAGVEYLDGGIFYRGKRQSEIQLQIESDQADYIFALIYGPGFGCVTIM